MLGGRYRRDTGKPRREAKRSMSRAQLACESIAENKNSRDLDRYFL